MSIADAFPSRPLFVMEEETFNQEGLGTMPLSVAPSGFGGIECSIVYTMAVQTSSKRVSIGFNLDEREWVRINEYSTNVSRQRFLELASEDAYEWAEEQYPESEHISE